MIVVKIKGKVLYVRDAFFLFAHLSFELTSSYRADTFSFLSISNKHTLLIFKGALKAYKRKKLCNIHMKDLPFGFRGVCLLKEKHFYLLKVIFCKIYRILPPGDKNVSALEGIFL